MSQETSKPPEESGSDPAPSGEQLQGWIPDLAGPDEVRSALDKALDFRGDITITLKSGETIEGYVFDRRTEGPSLDQCFARMIPRNGQGKVSIPYSDIARLEFTGRDAATGRRFEVWSRLHREKKGRGEEDVSIKPEPLE
jgi:hypothetical protein